MPTITAPSAKWFLREPSPDAGARLFCIPYSGCGASMYRNWPRFHGDIEICPVQLPGRENRFREQPYGTYEAMADDLAEVLLPYLDRPFGFFGHCASALPGYETSVRLMQRGYPQPVRVFVSSQVAPHRGPHGRFLEMSDEELAQEVHDLIVQLGGRPLPDLVQLALGILRADVEANKRYHLDEPVRLAVPITALGWTEDVEVDHTLMDSWADCGVMTKRLLTGPHYGFMDAPKELLDAFALDMGRVASVDTGAVASATTGGR